MVLENIVGVPSPQKVGLRINIYGLKKNEILEIGIKVWVGRRSFQK